MWFWFWYRGFLSDWFSKSKIYCYFFVPCWTNFPWQELTQPMGNLTKLLGITYLKKEKIEVLNFYFMVRNDWVRKDPSPPPSQKKGCKKWRVCFLKVFDMAQFLPLAVRCPLSCVGLETVFFSTTPRGPSSWQRCNRLACGRASCASMRFTKQVFAGFFVHPRWCRISSIKGMNVLNDLQCFFLISVTKLQWWTCVVKISVFWY